MNQLADQLAALCSGVLKDIEKVENNKAAAARVRKATLEIAKVGKEFRKVSIAEAGK